MIHRNANARINVKVLIVVLLVGAAVGVSLVAARQISWNMATETALEAGHVAYDGGDWGGAVNHWKIYLRRHPEDVTVLRKYGESLLNVRPPTAGTVTGAINAYSQLVKLVPEEDVAYERLATLYMATQEFDSLARVARTRLQHVADDPNASLWLAEAFVGQNQQEQARQTLGTLIAKLESRPQKCRQYVQACLLMSNLADDGDMQLPQKSPASAGTAEADAETPSEDPNLPKTPLEWLDRAVPYDPNCVELLLAHARLCRRMARDADTSESQAQTLMERARKDLEAADDLNSKNPHLLYALGEEWLHHSELQRAEAQLAAIDGLSPEVMTKSFFDPNEAKATRFLFVARLAVEKGEPQRAADLVAGTLESLTEPQYRLKVLPIAIDLHLAAGRVEDANDYLAKYVQANSSDEETRESSLVLASYRARVAMAKKRPYEVIDILQPIVQREGSNPQLWQLWDMLAAAYRQTQQTSRAVDTWTECLTLLERHPRVTDSMARRAAEIRAQLPRHYARLGDWNQVLASTGGEASADSNDLHARLLQIAAVVNRSAQQGERLDAAQCEVLDQELRPLRERDPNNVTIRGLQAILWEHRGQSDRAEAELKQAIEECGKPLDAQTQLVGLYQRMGRSAEAMALCRQAIERNPEIAELWSTLSDLHGIAGDRDAARRCLEEGLEKVKDEPARDSLSLRLASLELLMKDRAAGLARLTQLAKNDPQNTQARELLLAQPEIRDDPNVAEPLIAQLRQIEGEGGLKWRFQQASLWSSSRQWHSRRQEIIELLQYCIAADPRLPRPVLLLGSLYERLGVPRSAEGVYRQALAANPSAPEIAERLANLLISQGRQAEAVEILPSISPVRRPYVSEQAGDPARAIGDFQRRVENDIAKTDAESRIQLARLLHEQGGDARRALAYLDEARSIDPNSYTQIATRALILTEQDRVPEAFRALDDFVGGHGTFRAHWIRAAYLAEHGELERAERDFRKLTTFADNGAAGFELLAGFYTDSGRLDQAVEAAEEGVRAYPENLRLKYRQMQLLLRRGQPQDRERARQIRIALQKELPGSTDLMHYEAMEKLADPTPESLTEARQILEQTVNLDPSAVNAQLVLIDVLIRQGELRAASEQAVRAIEANPNSRPLRMARAKVELALGFGRTAFTLADQVLKDDPNNAEALRIAVNGALASKDRRLLEQAGAWIDGAAGRIPDEERVLARTRVYRAMEQPQQAIPGLEAYCQTEPGKSSVAALVTLTDLYRTTGDLGRAGKTIERAEALASNRQIVIHARFLLLVAQNRLADLKGISSAYISASDQELGMVVSAASRLMAFNTEEHRREALKLFQHGVATWPKSLEARLGLGLTLYTMGEAERAKQIYEGLFQEFPNNPQVLNDLAWILQEHDRDYKKALELASEGIRLSLGNPDLLENQLHLLDTRATILMKISDRLPEAKQDLEKLIRLLPADSPRTAKTLLKLGQACVQQKDLQQAKQHLTRAMEIDRDGGVFTAEERAEISQILQMETVAAGAASYSGGGE